MLWVIVFVAIALVGLVMVVCYGVWLAHKAADVMSEVSVLADRGAEFAELLGQISMPDAARAQPELHSQSTSVAQLR